MKTGGLATAVALAGGVGDLAGDAAEQAALFEADAPLPLEPAPRGKSGPKGGRPAGARNKSTEEARQFFLSRYRSPLMGLGEIYSRAPEELARELQLTRVVRHLAPGQESLHTLYDADKGVTGYVVWDRVGAFDRQVAAMQAALPYIEKKQPIAIDTQGAVAGIILIGDHAGVSDGGDGVLTLEMDAAEPAQPIEQYQDVSEDATVRHADEQSHEDAKHSNSWGEFQE